LRVGGRGRSSLLTLPRSWRKGLKKRGLCRYRGGKRGNNPPYSFFLSVKRRGCGAVCRNGEGKKGSNNFTFPLTDWGGGKESYGVHVKRRGRKIVIHLPHLFVEGGEREEERSVLLSLFLSCMEERRADSRATGREGGKGFAMIMVHVVNKKRQMSPKRKKKEGMMHRRHSYL